jgi:hypothetical protein
VNVSNVGRLLDRESVIDWVRGSLAQGSTLSMLMSERLTSLPVALLVAPSVMAHRETPRLDEHGRGYSAAETDRRAAALLDGVRARGARLLVVEDDLARRGDLALEGNFAFVDDRVVRWAELDDGAAAAVALMRSGSSGYPLNAFASNLSARELGLMPRSQLQPANLSAMVESAAVILASVYDAEAYVALLSPGVLEDV